MQQDNKIFLFQFPDNQLIPTEINNTEAIGEFSLKLFSRRTILSLPKIYVSSWQLDVLVV